VRKQDGVSVTCEAGHASCISPTKVKSMNQSINQSIDQSFIDPECKNQVSPAALPACQNSSAGVPSDGEGSGERREQRWTEDDDDDTLGWVILYSTVLSCTERTVRVFCL